ncbi:MAG: MFS transporter [Gammaproteobacteria bacterium]|nr:MFS transporter [Gammaproteobacteria bacterium]
MRHIKHHVLATLANIRLEERAAVLWSFLYFFSLLCSYYIIRPIRDEMGVQGGVENLQWLFTATFAAMLAIVPLFGWISSRYPRKRFLPVAYYFFVLNLVIFYLAFYLDFDKVYIARIFFVWVSVFNLFVVSVFWSLMVDVYNNEQSKRLFGFIAAGGTAGAISGPALTGVLAVPFGKVNLLLLSVVFLLIAVVCMKRIIHWSDYSRGNQAVQAIDEPALEKESPLGGSIIAGIRQVFASPYLLGICGLMLLFTTLSTFLYFQQAQIIKDNFVDSDARTSVFATIDLATNILTLILQLLIMGRLVPIIGLAWTLAIIPLLLAMGFLILSFSPAVLVLIVVQVIRRAGNYAIMRPAREMLYVVIDRESKYKAKNFIDTAVYRGGDAVSSWVYAGMKSMGLSAANIALIAAPVALVWAWVAYRMGKWQQHLSNAGRQ